MFTPIVRSIRHKFVLAVVAATLAALGVAATAMLAYELHAFRDSAVRDLAAQADIIGRASAPALAFNDPAAAAENLALLRMRPKIVSAAIYTTRNQLFASFGGTGAAAFPPAAEPDGYRVNGRQLVLFKRVMENNEHAGTVYLEAHYDVGERLYDYLGILFIVMSLSLLVALLVSTWLQRTVTQPILSVTDVAHRVMDKRDFSLRVRKTTEDEVGYLVDAFNDMLAEIGKRAAALEASNASLEQEMTERRTAQEALIAADHRKDEFLATLAHELRNPLAPLRNALEIVHLSGTNPQLVQQAHEMMARQLTQLTRLVDDLLDVSRITTGRLVLRTERAELGAIVRAAIETAGPMMEPRRHRLTVSLPASGVPIDADVTRLAQVFSNLLNNAAKYTDPGGEIGLAVHLHEGYAEVTVSDNGIGIPTEMLPEIFAMFTQVDRSLERLQAGLGVGLTLAKRLVELHGGSIEARSAGLGAGSQFVVRLPLSTAGAPLSPAPERIVPSAAPSSQRILVADDNEDYATSLALLLRGQGHEVAVAHDGLSAFELAQQVRPAFAFLDIGLPRLNGYELAQRLRASSPTANTVLVAITGWGQEKDKLRAHDAGFDHHLVKPADPADIERIVSALAH